MTTPTIPVTPATDEEVERLRERLTAQQAAAPNDGWLVDASATRKLLARFDAERSARERAEASLTKLRAACMSDYYASGHYEQACDERDEWKARAEKAEAQSARMREVLTDWAAIINDQGQCIACRRGPVDDHAADCIVAELLREK